MKIFYSNNPFLNMYINEKFNIKCHSYLEGYYPNFNNMSISYFEHQKGKYYEMFVSSCFRDNRVIWRDSHSQINRLYNIFKSECVKMLHEANTLYFGNIPHEGFDIVLAETCEELGKEWFAPWQVPTSPLAFQVYTNNFELVYSHLHHYYSFYNNPIYYDPSILKKNALQLNELKLKNSSLEMLNQKIYNFFSNKIERYRRKKFFNNSNFPSNKKIIVITLHKQPEASTEPLGFEYTDPILLINEVINFIKNNDLVNFFHVVIKEHPILSTTYRGKSFYAYLNYLKKLDFVSLSSLDIKLWDITNISGVVTVNGTSAFEALNKSVPVLCHKTAYYSNSQLAFSIENISDFFNECMNFRAQFSDNVMISHLFGGIVDPLYCGYDYNSQEIYVGYKSLFDL